MHHIHEDFDEDNGHDDQIYDDDIHGAHDDDGCGDVLVLTSGNLLHAQMRPLSNMQIVTITQS